MKEKTIAGAVLDVFREEPLPSSHPFWQTEGILVLPHIGGGHPQRTLAGDVSHPRGEVEQNGQRLWPQLRLVRG